MTKILITGAAGFIGYHTATRLIAQGAEVVGLDNLSPYYDVSLKQARLQQLAQFPAFRFVKADLADSQTIQALFTNEKFDQVIHLGAQAGVRYSLQQPMSYADSNLVGHLNILEACRHHGIQHLIYASSSSVYGNSDKVPFKETDITDSPVSLYAATKKANELMAFSYAQLYGIPCTGLRFFTVYGPWGRPDMAIYKFCKAILAAEPIDIYNHGELSRDFTYIDDIVEGIVRLLNAPSAEPIPAAIYNIGRGQPVRLMDFVRALESALEVNAIINMQPMQPGDVMTTWADTSALFEKVGYRPDVELSEGIARFVAWYRQFYQA
ncbi:NAD-dependent epimerase [Shewanella sp. GXUN23E]|uniref:NAD-dependent epimerase n=1 Tax=Shewanella sp. GXUN23E TaxID=3422498 RepID=UPI003D7CACCF